MVATSLGKAFGTTGFNHANILIPNQKLREAFADRRTRDHYGSMDPVAYVCLLAGYSQEGWDWIQASNEVMRGNMDAVKAFFAEHMPDVPVYGGEGGYILWIDWRNRFDNEAELMDFLYYKAFFHLDAGSNYGGPCFTRISLACPRRCVLDALSTLKKAITEKWGC
jgi:cystathionine beta-lyase